MSISRPDLRVSHVALLVLTAGVVLVSKGRFEQSRANAEHPLGVALGNEVRFTPLPDEAIDLINEIRYMPIAGIGNERSIYISVARPNRDGMPFLGETHPEGNVLRKSARLRFDNLYPQEGWKKGRTPIAWAREWIARVKGTFFEYRVAEGVVNQKLDPTDPVDMEAMVNPKIKTYVVIRNGGDIIVRRISEEPTPQEEVDLVEAYVSPEGNMRFTR